MVIEADGNPVKIRGTLLPNANNTYSLGSSSVRWYDAYLNNQLNFGNGLYIAKDASDRLGIYHNNIERVKIGNDGSSYFAISVDPDQDGLYNLGKSTLRWSVINATKLQNEFSSLTLRGKYNITCDGYVVPASNAYTLGNSNSIWANTFTTKITDGTNEIAVADIATKSNTAWFSGQFDNNGELHVDMTQFGVPEGMYFITFGGCMTYFYIAPGQVANLTDMGVANEFNLRAPCPMIFGGSGYPATLRISRQGDTLTLKVAAPNVGTQQAGYSAFIFKTNLA
jgi:hypothetical protein